MSDNLGLGVMINMLGGNKSTVEKLKSVLNKEIKNLKMEDDKLRFEFNDGDLMVVFDDGQSCCENRYMTTDDDLDYFQGSKLMDMEIKEAPNAPAEYDEHEVQFLVVKTSKGEFTMETHNEHNGYYGGFWIVAN